MRTSLASYIPNENQKLDIYKRIACIENEEESSEMMDELIDPFRRSAKISGKPAAHCPAESAGT